mmetsp:Transcript_22939/g.60382  ORF Transcript_22939/g.60382 Transcript_22939/m.60382 type:complete len:266 (-) Transcript_22939:202-999(-)
MTCESLALTLIEERSEQTVRRTRSSAMNGASSRPDESVPLESALESSSKQHLQNEWPDGVVTGSPITNLHAAQRTSGSSAESAVRTSSSLPPPPLLTPSTLPTPPAAAVPPPTLTPPLLTPSTPPPLTPSTRGRGLGLPLPSASRISHLHSGSSCGPGSSASASLSPSSYTMWCCQRSASNESTIPLYHLWSSSHQTRTLRPTSAPPVASSTWASSFAAFVSASTRASSSACHLAALALCARSAAPFWRALSCVSTACWVVLTAM